MFLNFNITQKYFKLIELYKKLTAKSKHDTIIIAISIITKLTFFNSTFNQLMSILNYHMNNMSLNMIYFYIFIILY